MAQEVKNQGEVDKQVNVGNVEGSVYLSSKTRFARRFEKLNQEVINNERYEGVMDALKYYLTKLDGVEMSEKLNQGGFEEGEIIKAARRKEKVSKHLERNRFFESAQWINSQLFAKIIIEFETHVEIPLINNGASKEDVMQAVIEKVVNPVLQLINEEGENDQVLNYTIEDILGMVYFLTGKCHINWAKYDNL